MALKFFKSYFSRFADPFGRHLKRPFRPLHQLRVFVLSDFQPFQMINEQYREGFGEPCRSGALRLGMFDDAFQIQRPRLVGLVERGVQVGQHIGQGVAPSVFCRVQHCREALVVSNSVFNRPTDTEWHFLVFEPFQDLLHVLVAFWNSPCSPCVAQLISVGDFYTTFWGRRGGVAGLRPGAFLLSSRPSIVYWPVSLVPPDTRQ